MAAAQAAECGRRTLLLEKNRKAGVKILMSGGTRCNITHATDNRGISAAFGSQGKFLHSALAAFGVHDALSLFEAEGVATKVEQTGKVFPVSDRASDVLGALLRRLGRTGCTLALDEPLLDFRPTATGFELTTGRRELTCRKLIVTTGGQSYPGCGTTGDGYRWAERLGHSVVVPRPSLVPLVVETGWLRALRGITLPDVLLRVVDRPAGDGGVARLAERRSSLLFTHFGLSGPAALDVSRAVSGCTAPGRYRLEIDLLPELSQDRLEEMISRSAASQGKRHVVALLSELLPTRLIAVLAHVCRIPPDRRCAELARQERSRITRAVKCLTLPVSGTLGFDKAEVTAGGINLTEVDSRTLQSKRVANLFFAGEILDLDGPIGGYNFQVAWSTGFLAGQSAAE